MAVLITDLPAGMVFYVDQNGDGTWPARPTTRTDLKVVWTRIVAGSADPAAVSAPSTAGAYDHDKVDGA